MVVYSIIMPKIDLPKSSGQIPTEGVIRLMLNQGKDTGKKQKKHGNLIWYLILHLLILFMSFGGVLSKAASQQDFMSLLFILLYAAELFVLFTYTIFWQQVLKRIPLTVAFCNKAVGMIWTTLWGVLIFKEGIPSVWEFFGIAIVLVGVVLVVTARE